MGSVDMAPSHIWVWCVEISRWRTPGFRKRFHILVIATGLQRDGRAAQNSQSEQFCSDTPNERPMLLILSLIIAPGGCRRRHAHSARLRFRQGGRTREAFHGIAKQ